MRQRQLLKRVKGYTITKKIVEEREIEVPLDFSFCGTRIEKQTRGTIEIGLLTDLGHLNMFRVRFVETDGICDLMSTMEYCDIGGRHRRCVDYVTFYYALLTLILDNFDNDMWCLINIKRLFESWNLPELCYNCECEAYVAAIR